MASGLGKGLEDRSVQINRTGGAYTIEYPPALLAGIRAEAVRGVFQLRHGGVEIGGVLFGLKKANRIRILECRGLETEHANGPGFRLSDQDYTALRRIVDDAAKDEDLTGLVPVGWYRSDARSSLDFSREDETLTERGFPDPGELAVILLPARFNSEQAAFFVRDAVGGIHGESASTQEPARPDVEPAPSALVVARPGKLRLRKEPEPVRRLRPGWLMAAITLGAFGVGVLTGVVRVGDAVPAPVSGLQLRAADHDGEVRIEWDRGSEPVAQAQDAGVVILDGGQRLDLALSRDLLHAGNLVYHRKSADVEIQLRVTSASGESAHELTRLVGLPDDRRVEVSRQSAADRGETSKPSAAAVPVALAKPNHMAKALAPPRVPQPAPAPAPRLETSPPPRPQAKLPPPAITAPDPPQAETPAPRAVPSPAKPGAVYRGPAAGRLIWTGDLPPGGALTIEGKQASTGFVTGSLPPAPVRIHAFPADFTGSGIEVYASQLPDGKQVTEQPSARNGWTKTVYKRNARRAAALSVAEAPSAHNSWRRMALRAGDQALSIIIVDWEVLSE